MLHLFLGGACSRGCSPAPAACLPAWSPEQLPYVASQRRADGMMMSAVERGAVPGRRRAPLAEKALSEAFGRLRFQDTSRLVWRQQQDQLARVGAGGVPPPGGSFLGRSRSARYTRYGNPTVVVPDRQRMMDGQGARSAICALM